MINTNMLISKIKLFGERQQDLADALGISLQSVNAKINGANGAEFNASQITTIMVRYKLTPEEVVLIFLNKNDTDKNII